MLQLLGVPPSKWESVDLIHLSVKGMMVTHSGLPEQNISLESRGFVLSLPRLLGF